MKKMFYSLLGLLSLSVITCIFFGKVQSDSISKLALIDFFYLHESLIIGIVSIWFWLNTFNIVFGKKPLKNFLIISVSSLLILVTVITIVDVGCKYSPYFYYVKNGSSIENINKFREVSEIEVVRHAGDMEDFSASNEEKSLGYNLEDTISYEKDYLEINMYLSEEYLGHQEGGLILDTYIPGELDSMVDAYIDSILNTGYFLNYDEYVRLCERMFLEQTYFDEDVSYLIWYEYIWDSNLFLKGLKYDEQSNNIIADVIITRKYNYIDGPLNDRFYIIPINKTFSEVPNIIISCDACADKPAAIDYYNRDGNFYDVYYNSKRNTSWNVQY